MATECALSWTLIGQAAQAVRDTGPTRVVSRCEGETAARLLWLRTRPERAAPQAPVVAP